jgi:hypothetical protein
MKIKPFFIIVFLSLFSNTFSFHSVYVGPDVFYRDYDEVLDAPAKSHEYGLLYGYQFGYEYFEPLSTYLGADLRCAYGNTVYDGSLQHLETHQIEPYTSSTVNDILNLEIRYGRIYGTSSWSIIPFFGMGYHSWLRGCAKNDPYGYDEDYSWFYTAIGLKSFYRINTNWSLGLNLKLMQMTNATMVSSDLCNLTFNLGERLQTEIELPLYYNLNSRNSFFNQIGFVPYFRNQNIGQSDVQTAYLENGKPISFVEPSSTTYLGGVRIEFRKNF